MTDHTCEDLHFHLNVQSFGDTNIKYLEVTGHCKVCDRKMRFRGPAGVNPNSPTVAIDGSQAIFPFLMTGEDYDGKAIGYSVKVGGAN